jgi:hypothetical protein
VLTNEGKAVEALKPADPHQKPPSQPPAGQHVSKAEKRGRQIEAKSEYHTFSDRHPEIWEAIKQMYGFTDVDASDGRRSRTTCTSAARATTRSTS